MDWGNEVIIRSRFGDNCADVAAPPSFTVHRWSGRKVLASFAVIVCCFQDQTIYNFGSFALKPFHLICLGLLLFSMVQRKSEWTIPSKMFTAAVLFILAISMMDYVKYGFNSCFLNYLFMLMICCGFYNLGFNFRLNDWIDVIQLSAFVVMAAIIVKLILNVNLLKAYFDNPWAGHPLIPTFFGGGVNLEASWMALFIPFFSWDKRGKAYIALSFIISFAYTSRAGLLICLMGLLYVYVIKGDSKGISIKLLLFILVLFSIFVVLFVQQNVLIERLLSAGSDRGSEGRLNMWQYALPTFLDSPLFGCGAGNATNHIRELFSMTGITEDNVHMYVLQVILDFGVSGLLIYLGLVISFLFKCSSDRVSSPFEAWLLFYFLASFIQFRGADVLLGICLAGYFLNYGKKQKS